MKKAGLILAGMLVALCILGLVSPAKGQVLPPKISLEMDGVPVMTLNIHVCSEFTLEFWIRDIPPGYSMVYFDYNIKWDPNLMELKDADPIEPIGWDHTVFQVEPGLILGKGYRESPQVLGWTEDATWAHLTFHCLGEGTGVILLTSPLEATMILLDESGYPHNTEPEPFEVTVHQFKAVGGVLHSVDKLAVLSPYLALIGLVGVVTVAVAIRRRNP